jgi:UDP-glucose 4-epimerase
MKALVTGGAGFIGSNLADYLLQNGFSVKVLDNLSTGYRKNLDLSSIELIEGDIRDSGLVAKACQEMDVIFHLAASIGNVKSLANPQEDSSVNVIGTLNVLEGARKANVNTIVYSSSAAIFGELLTMPIAEDHPQNPDSPYGVSKLAGEKHMLCFSRLYRIRVVCLRYFNVYGVRQRYDAYGNVIPIFAERLLSGKPLTIYGDGEQTRDFVNVKDVAKANYLAATRAKETGVFNIGSGHNITINQLARYCQEASGFTASEIIHAARRPSEVLHCRANIRKAGSELDFRPDPDIQFGLMEYFDWLSDDRGMSKG